MFKWFWTIFSLGAPDFTPHVRLIFVEKGNLKFFDSKMSRGEENENF